MCKSSISTGSLGENCCWIVAVGLVVTAVALPAALQAQPGVPTAAEVREALDTLRRFERALASQPQSDSIPPHQGHLGINPNVPLTTSTVGSSAVPQVIYPPASFSLALDGDIDLGGFVFKQGDPFIHAGYGNTAVGLNALVTSTPAYPNYFSGKNNSAFGSQALKSNTEGYRNTAVGAGALAVNSTGRANTATGYRAMVFNESGFDNTASGYAALLGNTVGYRNTATGRGALEDNLSGHFNTAVGAFALRKTTGSSNTAVGSGTGSLWTTGSYNIALGAGATGVDGESQTIRIGGSSLQTKTFIEGIGSATGTFGTDVCIDVSTDQLGPCSGSRSSRRFKQDVEPVGDLHEAMAALKPVSFRYRPEFTGTHKEDVRYGLIAEEVAAVFPSLVSRDEHGRPYTVRYDLLTPLLLAEMQRRGDENAKQSQELAELRQVVVDLRRRLDAIE